MGSLEASAVLLHSGQGMQTGRGIMPQTARIGIDYRLQLRTALLHCQELVHLFLVFYDGKARLGMLEDKVRLLSDRVLIEWYRHPTQALRRHHGPVQVRTVIANDRYFVP